MSIGSLPQADGAAYARFAPRLRAVIVDVILMTLLWASTLALAVASQSDHVARVVGFTFICVWLLYEPILVSLTGGTVGHYLCNLRVVDDQSHSNVGFLKAVARLVIKTVLGLVSFITMAATRRHQAVHDLLTRSSVQMRDLTKARPHHYSGERTELLSPTMPSRGRRLLVIAAYLLVSFVLFSLSFVLMWGIGLISEACFVNDRCSQVENIWISALAVGWLGLCALCIGFGWRGRLWGCRARSTGA
jgi:uncharacterized RDD family membrane protein YckC